MRKIQIARLGGGLWDSDDSKSADDHITSKDAQEKWMMLAQEECASALELIKTAKAKLSGITRDETVNNFQRDSGHPDSFAAWLKKTYADRTNRIIYFPIEGIFGEPCWDILLDLAINKVSSKIVSITSACIASKVPITTALRWIAILEEHGLIARTPDPHDKRRTYIELSEQGYALMRKYFESVQ